MSYLTNKVSAAAGKTKDDVQRMNRINYYSNQIKRLASQQGDFPFEKRPGLGKEMTAMYQALWKEYQGMGWTLDKFEKDVSTLIGKNFHAGAIAKHAEEYDNAIEAIDDIIEHAASTKSHKNYRMINGRLVYVEPESEAAAEKYQNDGKKKTTQYKIVEINDAGKRRTERARAMMAANIAQNRGKNQTDQANVYKNVNKAQADGKRKTDAYNAGVAANKAQADGKKKMERTAAYKAASKYQEDGMKRTVIEEQKQKAKADQAETLRNKYGDNNAKNQAESSMAGYEEWKKKQQQKVKHSDEYYEAIEAIDNMIEHHGVRGMKWGIRRYQNPDGSLTELGKKHYGEGTDHRTEKVIENFKQQKSIALSKGNTDFAREFMDYLSNAEISAFQERITARTKLDDLKQASRKVTEEKLKSWSSMAQSTSQFIASGISTYNNIANIINAVTKKRTWAPINNNGPGKGKDGGK